MKKHLLPIVPWFIFLALFLTGGLLWLKGVLPNIEPQQEIRFLLWFSLQALPPAIVSGILLWLVVWGLSRQSELLYRPFDIGRALSVGGIFGALIHPADSYLLFHVLHRGQPAPFWIATNTISGCLAGALSVLIVFSRLAKVLPPAKRNFRL